MYVLQLSDHRSFPADGQHVGEHQRSGLSCAAVKNGARPFGSLQPHHVSDSVSRGGSRLNRDEHLCHCAYMLPFHKQIASILAHVGRFRLRMTGAAKRKRIKSLNEKIDLHVEYSEIEPWTNPFSDPITITNHPPKARPMSKKSIGRRLLIIPRLCFHSTCTPCLRSG